MTALCRVVPVVAVWLGGFAIYGYASTALFIPLPALKKRLLALASEVHRNLQAYHSDKTSPVDTFQVDLLDQEDRSLTVCATCGYLVSISCLARPRSGNRPFSPITLGRLVLIAFPGFCIPTISFPTVASKTRSLPRRSRSQDCCRGPRRRSTYRRNTCSCTFVL